MQALFIAILVLLVVITVAKTIIHISRFIWRIAPTALVFIILAFGILVLKDKMENYHSPEESMPVGISQFKAQPEPDWEQIMGKTNEGH